MKGRPDIQMIASEPNYVGSGMPHVGPWEYVQHVPMLWYGPGHNPAVGPVARPVTAAGIAPTQGALLDYPFHPIDGQVMREVLPKGSAVEPPQAASPVINPSARRRAPVVTPVTLTITHGQRRST